LNLGELSQVAISSRSIWGCRSNGEVWARLLNGDWTQIVSEYFFEAVVLGSDGKVYALDDKFFVYRRLGKF
jgi:hypothetical protein